MTKFKLEYKIILEWRLLNQKELIFCILKLNKYVYYRMNYTKVKSFNLRKLNY